MEGGSGPDSQGMIPRAVAQIFQTAGALQAKGWVYTLKASFIEVRGHESMAVYSVVVLLGYCCCCRGLMDRSTMRRCGICWAVARAASTRSRRSVAMMTMSTSQT